MAKRTVKSKHYQLVWNVIETSEHVDTFKLEHGESAPLPYSLISKIYSGSLVDAIFYKRIPNLQHYGVTFKTTILVDDGSIITDEANIHLSESMKFSQFMNGMKDCYVKDSTGFKTKGWEGAVRYWSKMIEHQYPDVNGELKCIATANVLVKGSK